ncbi:hypothetical protein ACH41C_06705 [Streptomyces althioticus]|uniref:hypothetical protein n=1 Tax=Streptomyces althioticus TaxID=83380 RepID=UPI00369B1E76
MNQVRDRHLTRRRGLRRPHCGGRGPCGGLSSEGDSSGTAVAWAGRRYGTDDCLDELRDHFDGG